MLSREENERLTQVGAGTPMGDMLRRYWIPACMAEELAEPGGPPRRLRLLGEDLVAFRGADGTVGIMDELCPHRRASLALGRNDDNALTCLYHGWRIAADGRIVDMPSEPEGSTFKDRLRHVAYPVAEAGSFVWVYLGPPDTAPPLPSYAWMRVPESNRAIAKVRESANWVQALEGAIDSAHVSVLHQDLVKGSTSGRTTNDTGNAAVLHERPSVDTRPRLEVDRTPYGFRYAAVRTPIVDPETTKYIRITAWAAPFFTFLAPNPDFAGHVIFIPVDDENTIMYHLQWSERNQLDADSWRAAMGVAVGLDVDEDHYKVRTVANDFLQDRAAMQEGRSFTGIHGLLNQDMAVQESMGRIVDRSREHLGTSDVAVIVMRRLLLDSARRFSEGESPLGLGGGFRTEQIGGAATVMPIDERWQEFHDQALAMTE
jgi:phthalate 4,5-dioxygenase